LDTENSNGTTFLSIYHVLIGFYFLRKQYSSLMSDADKKRRKNTKKEVKNVSVSKLISMNG